MILVHETPLKEWGSTLGVGVAGGITQPTGQPGRRDLVRRDPFIPGSVSGCIWMHSQIQFLMLVGSILGSVLDPTRGQFLDPFRVSFLDTFRDPFWIDFGLRFGFIWGSKVLKYTVKQIIFEQAKILHENTVFR